MRALMTASSYSPAMDLTIFFFPSFRKFIMPSSVLLPPLPVPEGLECSAWVGRTKACDVDDKAITAKTAAAVARREKGCLVVAFSSVMVSTVFLSFGNDIGSRVGKIVEYRCFVSLMRFQATGGQKDPKMRCNGKESDLRFSQLTSSFWSDESNNSVESSESRIALAVLE